MTIKNKFKEELESIHKSLIEVSDWMYENPELGFEEYKTSENVNVDDDLSFVQFVTIYFKDPAQAKQLYDALLPKIKPRKSVHVNYGNLYSYVMISYPQM